MSEDEDMRLPACAAHVSKTITVEDISDSFSDAAPARSPALPPGVMKEQRSLQRRAHSTSTSRAVPKMLSNSLTQVEQQSQSLSEQVFEKAPHSAQNRQVSKLTRSAHPPGNEAVSLLYSPVTPTAPKHFKFLDDLDDDEILPARPLRGNPLWESEQPLSGKSHILVTHVEGLPTTPDDQDEDLILDLSDHTTNAVSNFEAKNRSELSEGMRKEEISGASSREGSSSCLLSKQTIVFADEQTNEAATAQTRRQTDSERKTPTQTSVQRRPPKMPLEVPEVKVPEIEYSVRNYTRQEVDDMLLDLDIKKDWNVEFKTLQKVQNIATNEPDILVPSIDALMNLIHKLLQCLRSAVFKEAIIAISVLYARFAEREMTLLSEFIEMSMFQTLLKAGSASEADFLAESADLCLRNMDNYLKMLVVKCLPPKPVVQTLQMLNRCTVDKAPGVRSRAAFLASDIFDILSNEIAYGNDFPKQIFRSVSQIYLEVLPKITQDSNEDCRKAGRRLYFFCKQLCGECGIGIGLESFRTVEDVIHKDGVSKMWWDNVQ